MHRVAPAIDALFIALTAAIPAPAVAAGPAPEASAPVIVADLDGTSIPVSAIPTYHCHDRAFPAIHCFPTEAARDLALAGGASSGRTGTRQAARSASAAT